MLKNKAINMGEIKIVLFINSIGYDVKSYRNLFKTLDFP